jgi:hypothetical protein
MIHSHAALMKLFGILGMFLGFAAQLEFTQRVKGPMWWQLQPLAVTFAPILVGVLGGMFLGIRLAMLFPARCPFCRGRSWNRRGGESRRWGYWCSTCGRNGIVSPDLQPVKNPPVPVNQ